MICIPLTAYNCRYCNIPITQLRHSIKRLTDATVQQYAVSREKFDAVLKHGKMSQMQGRSGGWDCLC